MNHSRTTKHDTGDVPASRGRGQDPGRDIPPWLTALNRLLRRTPLDADPMRAARLKHRRRMDELRRIDPERWQDYP